MDGDKMAWDWSSKLGELALSGIGVVCSYAVPEHLRRRALARFNDFNPWDVINGNHDLLRGARLAWVEAATEVLDAATECAKADSREHDSSKNLLFAELARETFLRIRRDALDRRPDVGVSPIDRHIQVIMQGTSEFVAPGDDGGSDTELTQEFNNTLAAVTNYPVQEIPGIFAQIARDGLPMIGGRTRRSFGDLVFAAFAELLKSRDKYPEALPAFNIAMDNAALKLTQAVSEKVKGIDHKLDQLLASADALKVFQSGAQQYLDALPKLLEGQARIEAFARDIKDDTQALLRGQEDLKKDVSQILQKIQTTAQTRPNDGDEAIVLEYQKLVAHLDRGEFEQVLAYRPRNLDAYRARCIARWSQPRYAIDKRFTPLTLLLDQGEEAGERYQKDRREFTDLRDALDAIDATKEPVLVVTGAPGSGKSTLLRRLELDLASAALGSVNPDAPLTIFLPLNAFGQRGSAIPDPEAWVAQQWADSTAGLLEFDALLGRPLVLLLDGLNEMPHTSNEDYDDRLTVWKNFLDRLVRDHPRVRVVFSCRTLDYGAKLPTKELPRVPQVEVNALTPEQVQDFLKCYSPEYADPLYAQLKDSPQLDLYRSPFYLKLLIDQATDGNIPEGRAALFTGFARSMLKREIAGDNPRFRSGVLLHGRDRERIGQWTTPYELPGRGALFKALAAFAFRLQERRGPGDKSQVRVDYDRALENLSDVPAKQQDELLKAAADLQILELPSNDVLFVHQLLQEYFAARHIAELVNAAATPVALAELVRLAQVKWLAADIQESVAQLLQTLPKSGTLPDLPTTGWEETFTLTVALLPAPDAFLRALAQYNLPLAGRCAAQPDVQAKVSASVIVELRQALLERSRDPATDLRARISAGLALGDHRFEVEQGLEGSRYLMPPLVAVAGGAYAIGSNDGIQEDETPVHEVELAPFSLGQFPVTNAEYRCFVEGGGYENERWWETDAGRRWRRGEGTAESGRNDWRYWRDRFKREDGLLVRLAEEQAWTEERQGQWQGYCEMTDEIFEAMLENQFRDLRFSEPRYWNDAAYNVPNQPVVGVCWFEARAYCAWLSEQTGRSFRLPTEAEWEAAARGKTRASDDGQPLSEGRRYAWGNEDKFFSTFCNSLETKLRRTTPVGVFPDGDTPAGAKPNGLADMTGNVWEWTSTVYDQKDYPYPYKKDDGREDPKVDGPRVARGGSWLYGADFARCAFRDGLPPGVRSGDVGFRVALGPAPVS